MEKKLIGLPKPASNATDTQVVEMLLEDFHCVIFEKRQS